MIKGDIMVLYSIKDLKGNFGVPMAFQNDDMAIRAMPFMSRVMSIVGL